MHAKPATFPPSSSHQPTTILLVEDERGVRDLMRSMLLQRGYIVLFAGDSQEALNIAGMYRESIDLLITDVVMPGVNGPELARRLRALRPNLRVLFISGLMQEATIRSAPLSDAGFLAKPFPAEVLVGKVQEMLQKDSG
ncbi:MAG TPA: response regulator [Nitrospiraceae bacterium]|nr:response regulator [Nitrospiraceae bacterium]